MLDLVNTPVPNLHKCINEEDVIKLKKFYNVDTIEQLIYIQNYHVEKLQIELIQYYMCNARLC